MSIGFHISRKSPTGSQNILAAIEHGIETLTSYGFKRQCAQIFVSGPRSFIDLIPATERSKIYNTVKKAQLDLIIHGAYVDNPWGGSKKSIHNIKQEMKCAYDIGATGVVIHLGSKASDESFADILRQIADLPEEVLESITLWLEIHSARPNDTTYETSEKLHRLFARVKDADVKLKIGLCIDSAHLYSCGMSLTTYEVAAAWLAALPEVPILFHLNDSHAECGRGKDIHAHLTGGNIWGAFANDGIEPVENSGIAAILDWCTDHNISVILERNEEKIKNDLDLISGLGYFT